MSTPPVPPPVPNDPHSGNGQEGSPESAGHEPRYGQNAPQYGQQFGQGAPQYGQNAPQYGQNAPQYGQNAPQYGQNAPQYGQQPYGQNAPQYGQQPYGQSPYGQYPSEQPQAAGAGGVPQLVNISFWLLIASGVLFVIAMLSMMGQLDDPAVRGLVEQAIAQSGAGTAMSYETFISFAKGTLIAIAIVGAILYALTIVFVRKGRNWARVFGTVVAVISLALPLFFPSIFSLLAVFLGIAAIVLLYLPAASPYFRKQQPFSNPYSGGFGNPYGR